MSSKFLSKPTPATRRRLWWMYHIIFVLLLTHFLAIHLVPGYFQVLRSDWVRPTPPNHFQPNYQQVIEREDGLYLWGGPDDAQDFDIADFRLNPDQLEHGLGREAFPALIEPRFESLEEADEWLTDGAHVLVLEMGGEVRVYPVPLMINHEVVNDVVDGVPVFAAYCVLADLGAIYDRRIAGETFTFAVSGYTYSDPNVWDGMSMFILWDRETESLWWPGNGKAVSGLMLDTPLPLIDEQHWSQTVWGRVKGQYDEADVLQRGQEMEPPETWPRLTAEDLAAAATEQQETRPDDDDAHIAPRWGRNPNVDG